MAVNAVKSADSVMPAISRHVDRLLARTVGRLFVQKYCLSRRDSLVFRRIHLYSRTRYGVGRTGRSLVKLNCRVVMAPHSMLVDGPQTITFRTSLVHSSGVVHLAGRTQDRQNAGSPRRTSRDLHPIGWPVMDLKVGRPQPGPRLRKNQEILFGIKDQLSAYTAAETNGYLGRKPPPEARNAALSPHFT